MPPPDVLTSAKFFKKKKGIPLRFPAEDVWQLDFFLCTSKLVHLTYECIYSTIHPPTFAFSTLLETSHDNNSDMLIWMFLHDTCMYVCTLVCSCLCATVWVYLFLCMIAITKFSFEFLERVYRSWMLVKKHFLQILR